MTCNKVQSMLSAYCDREMTGVEMFLLRQHLQDCPQCKAEEDAIREIKSVLCSMDVEPPADDFEERLVLNVMGACSAGRVLEPSFRVSMPIAVVTIGAAAALCLFYGFRASETQPTKSGGIAAGSRTGGITSQSQTAKRSSDMSAALDRDRAFIQASDPLSGPQVAVAAGYARP